VSIVVDTTRNVASGITTVRVAGDLTFASAPTVRSALAASASECPTGVVVDLAGLEVSHRGLLVLFTAAAQRARAQWGVPLLLCCARPDVAHRISLFRPSTQVYDSLRAAEETLRGRVTRWRHQRFPPVPTSTGLACGFVAQACTHWGAADLQESATLIVTELASNAIEHAATAFDVTVGHTTTYLRIGVQDSGRALSRPVPGGSTIRAASERGLGLHVVDALAATWNTADIGGGKIVWALLRTRPPGAPQSSEPLYQHGATRTPTVDGPDHEGTAAAPNGSFLRQSAPAHDLSDREIEVLGYLPTMLTAGDIAAEMYLSVNTIKAHMRSIYTKLDVSRRQDAVFRAYDRGLLS
jgi:DNA-binding CsgD family transcriptional regulator/anti-anti-sigma regulatory factor/anti-sigma regulatory factor (Ser/Thr protein kinase)